MKTTKTLGSLGVGLIVIASLCWVSQAIAAETETPSSSWSAIAVTGPTNLPPQSSEIQQIAIDAEGGTFTLSFEGQTTDPIAFDADASAVEAALDSLASITGPEGEVAVSGGPGDAGGEHPYFVSFGGELMGLNVAQMSADSSALTGSAHTATVTTKTQGGTPGTGKIAAYAQNVGGLVTNGTPVTLTDELPVGLEAPGTVTSTGWNCTVSGNHRVVTCIATQAVKPGTAARAVLIPVSVTSATTGTLENHVSVIGGGASNVGSYAEPVTISWSAARPGFQAFNAGAYDADGTETTQAGSHPYNGSSAVFANTVLAPSGVVVPAGDPKTISVDLPPGFLGNPIATEQCAEGQRCNANDIVGTVQPILQEFGHGGEVNSVFNLEAPIGYPAEFEFKLIVEVIRVVGNLNSESDYSLNVTSPNTPQVYGVYGVFFNFWGAPADSSHDSERCGEFGQTCGEPSTGPNTAFLTMPTDCAFQATQPESPLVTLNLDTWLSVGQFTTSAYHVPRATGCDKLHLEDSFAFEPSETRSDSPASFRTELAVPSEGLTDPEKLATPEIQNTVVKLPQGVTLNASSADGLEACSESQIGLKNPIDSTTGLPTPEPGPSSLHFSKEENHCPEASKIGTGELKTALLEETLHGDLYLAAQGKGNPFGSLFAVYLVIEDPRNGIFIKLPGEVEANNETGQLEVSFENLPQLPFTRLNLTLKGGARSPLASPTTCGHYATTATATPWSYPESGPPTVSSNDFEINEGPSGGFCAKTAQERPFDLGWSAGAEKTQAGESGPFDFQVTRADGSQELERLELQTPQGISASLAGIPYCTEAEIKSIEQTTGKQELEHPSCPATSQVGTTQTGAGSGPTPFYTSGKLYLAGPYKGAPISVVAVTPALAGPFDLGNVVVRSALFVNPETARITAKTDAIPQILDGVVLRIKDVRIHLDRNDWTINPTSCEPMSAKLTAHGNSGATAERSARFQVSGCENLPFKPNLKLQVLGGTGRNAKPRLKAVLTAKPGEANIATAQVNLPHSEFLEQNHIKTVCTRVQFAEGNGNGSACPAGSIYGKAKAWTPLLDHPLEGYVYLRSNGGERKLPDVVAALNGQVDIALWGKVDSGKNHGIRNTFEVVPDAPVSRFVLEMNGGKKGLLVNSENLCSKKAKRLAIVRFTGQNGKVHAFKPVVQNQCGKAKKGKKSGKK
jgi:hypothetical protein